MRELTINEQKEVGGGIIPALIAVAAAALLGGCATIPVKKTPPKN